MSRLYYTAPAQELFDEMKAAATRIWSGYDEPYRSEKLARIEDISNIGDNFMYLFAMFDIHNQSRVGFLLSENARRAVRERMIDGGASEHELPF